MTYYTEHTDIIKLEKHGLYLFRRPALIIRADLETITVLLLVTITLFYGIFHIGRYYEHTHRQEVTTTCP